MMFDFLARWLKRNKRTLKPRLLKDDVLKIARQAAAKYPHGEELNIVNFEERSRAIVWVVSSATVGRMLEVLIDDASGKVLEINQVGTR